MKHPMRKEKVKATCPYCNREIFVEYDSYAHGMVYSDHSSNGSARGKDRCENSLMPYAESLEMNRVEQTKALLKKILPITDTGECSYCVNGNPIDEAGVHLGGAKECLWHNFYKEIREFLGITRPESQE